jgi:hypothetical protein
LDTSLWIATGILAAMMAIAGLTKALQPRDKLIASGPGMAYVDDFDDQTIKLIGIAEIVGAAGLILPGILDIAPILVPVAAICLAVLLVGGSVVHLRRGEQSAMALPLALLVLAVVVAVGRFAIEPL